MSELKPYLALIPGLPLLASVLTAFLGPRILRKQSHWPVVLALAASFVLACIVFANIYSAEGKEPAGEGERASATEEAKPRQIREYYHWIVVGEPGGGIDVGLTLRADALSSMMAVMVTFIATWIAIYSIGYMGHDPGYPRFFAEISLFVAAMTTLVLADNLLVLFIGWEGVGLCSYLLIGFWFAKPSAADAARKAFLVTRIGDVGLFLGLLLLWTMFGTFEYAGIFKTVEAWHSDGTLNLHLLGLACLLLFCGAAGKSAQFPLHVWLPDAMEGPTPVSALIHAATMVTAGVYLVARFTPLYVLAPGAQLTVGCIGAFTAIMAALIALTQNDLKRVLAYSTLSQLGYMFLALGCGVTEHLATFAATAAMFHLFTHAFFKALLFLASGSVMHAMGDVIDMKRFSGLRKVMPATHWTFLVGALALAGVPPLAGFWSKDEILDSAHLASRQAGGTSGAIYFLLLIVGLVTAGLTAFYTFRAYFKTFWGDLRVPPEADAAHHGHGHGPEAHGGPAHAPAHGAPTPAPAPAPAAHSHAGPRSSYESPPVMTVPLVVLAVFAALVGFLVGPLMPAGWQFAHFLDQTPGFPHAEHEGLNWLMMGLSTLIALGGIALAWLLYVKQPDLPRQLAHSATALYQLSLNKFHFDELYGALIVRPLEGVSVVLRVLDLHVVDGLVDLVGHLFALFGSIFRPVQNGLVQFYAVTMVFGLGIFLIMLLIPLLRAM